MADTCIYLALSWKGYCEGNCNPITCLGSSKGSMVVLDDERVDYSTVLSHTIDSI